MTSVDDEVFVNDTPDRNDVAHIAATVSARCYRAHEKERIVATLLANSPILVVSGQGMGKSTLARFVAEDLRSRGFPVAVVFHKTVKQVLVDIAEQLRLGISSLDGKTRTTTQLQTTIAEDLRRRTAFLLFDDAHRLPVNLRAWLIELMDVGANFVLFATHPPKKDLFLKLGRIELKPLDRQAIRELMTEAARDLELPLDSSRLSELQERCGGNPMLARRVIHEEHLGLEEATPDHTDWIDGTPLLIAGLMIFAVLRFIGRGLHSTDLYLLGGVLTVAVGVVRVLIFSLPRVTNRIGQ